MVAVRGPLHAIDGWSYLGRAISALLSGQTHVVRHLSYYAELRAALSILASSGVGIFNRQHVVIDSTGAAHTFSQKPTHQIAWLTLAEWAVHSSSLERLIKPMAFAGASLLDPFDDFFPAQRSTAAGELMERWGFDLQQGMVDRDERNWSSYQPTALQPAQTTPAQDSEFLRMFWHACRPSSIELERHLLRILLETEALGQGFHLYELPSRYDRLHENIKAVISFEFLKRELEPIDHDFLCCVASSTLPAPPYAMMSRAALLLKLATGMAEENLRSAGVQPVKHFDNWWQDFGVSHGLWRPGLPPATTADLWDDIDAAIEDIASAPTAHRHEWVSAMAGNAIRMCETERVALWGLFP